MVDDTVAAPAAPEPTTTSAPEPKKPEKPSVLDTVQDFAAPEGAATTGDDAEILASAEAETESKPVTQPDDDDQETTLRDGKKVKISELKRAYNPNWDAQVRDLTAKQQAFAQETAGFTQAQQMVAASLNQAVEYVKSRMPQPPDPRLLDSDPFEYQRRKAWHERETARLNDLQVKRNAHLEFTRQNQQRAYAQYVTQQRDAVLAAMPELRDRVEATKFTESVKELGTELGFSPQELSQIADARVVRLIALALKSKQYEQRLAKAKEKLKTTTEAAKPTVHEPSRRQRTPSQIANDSLRARVDRLSRNPNSSQAAEDVLSMFK